MQNKSGETLEYATHKAERDDVIIVIGHGLTGEMSREMCVYLAENLATLGWPTLRFSFTGHGKSEGEFSDMTISKEVEDLISIIDQHRGSRKLAYIGHSMGAAVGALTAAKDDRIDTLISLAGMVHTKQFYDQEFSEQSAGESVMWEKEECPLSTAFRDDLYDIDTVIPAVKDIRLPWLLIHGSADDVVFPNHSEDLMNGIKGPKKHVVINEADHLFENHLPQVLEEIQLWLKQCFKCKPDKIPYAARAA